MSRASDYAIILFKHAHGPLRCLAASDPCNRRKADKPETQAPALREETGTPEANKEGIQ